MKRLFSAIFAWRGSIHFRDCLFAFLWMVDNFGAKDFREFLQSLENKKIKHIMRKFILAYFYFYKSRENILSLPPTLLLLLFYVYI